MKAAWLQMVSVTDMPANLDAAECLLAQAAQAGASAGA
jgi:predicted amidohydrolase